MAIEQGVGLGSAAASCRVPPAGRDDELERPVGLHVHLLLVHRGAGAGATATEPAPEKRLKLIHFASPSVPQIR